MRPPKSKKPPEGRFLVRGAMLKTARIKKGWGYQELSDRTRWIDEANRRRVLSVNTIKNAEEGGPCYLSTIRLLAEALGIEPDSLLVDKTTTCKSSPNISNSIESVESRDAEPLHLKVQSPDVFVELKLLKGSEASRDKAQALLRQIQEFLADKDAIKLIGITAGIGIVLEMSRSDALALESGFDGGGLLLPEVESVTVPAWKGLADLRAGIERLASTKSAVTSELINRLLVDWGFEQFDSPSECFDWALGVMKNLFVKLKLKDKYNKEYVFKLNEHMLIALKLMYYTFKNNGINIDYEMSRRHTIAQRAWKEVFSVNFYPGSVLVRPFDFEEFATNILKYYK